jgi:hypothetical protein
MMTTTTTTSKRVKPRWREVVVVLSRKSMCEVGTVPFFSKARKRGQSL